MTNGRARGDRRSWKPRSDLAYAARSGTATEAAPSGRHLGATFSGGILLGPAIGGWLSAAAGYQAAFVVSAAGRLLALLLVLAIVREPVRAGASGERRGATHGVLRASETP